MINKLTIEQLERLKDLAITNNEYGIAKDLREEIVDRKEPEGWDCIVAVKGVTPHFYLHGIRILFTFGEKDMFCNTKDLCAQHKQNNADEFIKSYNESISTGEAKKFKTTEYRKAFNFMLS